MELQILVVLAIALVGCLYLINQRSNANKKAAREFASAESFEDKMLILQKASLKRLQGIDATLDFFFWFMVVGLVLYGLYYFFSVLAFL